MDSEQRRFQSRTVGKILKDSAREFGDKPFVYFLDEQISFREMDCRSNGVANWLLAQGVRKGDKVIILMGNCCEWLYTWFGIAKIGAVAVPLNVYHMGHILAYLINDSDARLAIVDKGIAGNIAAVAEDLHQLQTLVVNPNDADIGDIHLTTVPYDELLQSSQASVEGRVRSSDILAIMYTSGTTGLSKGVMQSHNQYAWIGEQVAAEVDYKSEDIFYCWLPLFHIAAVGMATMASLLLGASIALTDGFSLSAFWAEIKRFGATATGAFSTVIELLYKQPPGDCDADNTLRRIICGGIPEDIREDFEQRFDLVMTEDYGLTEAEPISYSTPDDRKPRSMGKPVSDMEVNIVDDDDIEMGPLEIGEIVVRPLKPNILMMGYYKKPEQTVAAWRNLWFHTGDFGYMDEDGYLYFVDRKDDTIRRRGENISSVELESIINQHAGVLECAAVAVPSELGEDDVKVVVQLKPGESLTPEELAEFCEKNMARFMVPRYIEFIEEFPKTQSAKIKKDELKEVSEKTWDREKTSG